MLQNFGATQPLTGSQMTMGWCGRAGKSLGSIYGGEELAEIYMKLWFLGAEDFHDRVDHLKGFVVGHAIANLLRKN